MAWDIAVIASCGFGGLILMYLGLHYDEDLAIFSDTKKYPFFKVFFVSFGLLLVLAMVNSGYNIALANNSTILTSHVVESQGNAVELLTWGVYIFIAFSIIQLVYQVGKDLIANHRRKKEE